MGLSPKLAVAAFRDGGLRAFRYPDFRILWTGAFLSFVGSWIQNVAQGWLVYEITRDVRALALVTFLGSIPVAIIGPFVGAAIDSMDRRKLLIICQVIFGMNALILAGAIYFHSVQYWMILAAALINGVAGTFETPARQSLISTIIPPEDLSAAVPINAMTFNLARLVGPAIGGVMLSLIGAELCYFVNGLSYIALIVSLGAVKANISVKATRGEPIKDLVLEGMRYTMINRNLRMVFLLECCLSAFGLFYIGQLPAIARDMLGLGKQGLGNAMTCVGVGTLCALFTLVVLSDRPYKTFMLRLAMTVFGLGLMALGLSHVHWVSFIILAAIGGAAMMQFNLSNTLFQLIAPPNLRGRVLAMHIWALSGIGTFTVPLFGQLAYYRGLPFALQVGGALVFVGAVAAWLTPVNFDAAIPVRESA